MQSLQPKQMVPNYGKSQHENHSHSKTRLPDYHDSATNVANSAFYSNCVAVSQWRIQTRRLGGSQIWGRQKCLHLLKNQRLSATIVVCHTKEVIFCRSRSGYFCGSNYAIFQRITAVWKRFISLIQITFETGPKQWASFFTSYREFVYLQNVFKRYKKACCAQAFATVLAIRSEISEEQCLKRIPDLVRNTTALLRLGSDNSCAAIGLKYKTKRRSCFQAKLVRLHVHERLIYCWSDGSKTTREWKAFARTHF